MNIPSLRFALPLLVALVAVLVGPVAAAAPGASAGPAGEVAVSSKLVSHDALFLDEARTRPSIFGYTTELTASAALPVEPGTDLIADALRLDRDEVVPNAPADTRLTWAFAARGAPAKINAQDSLPAHVVTPARGNPYATSWYQRQEVARDLWSWGGVLAGGVVSGNERSQNAVFGLGPSAVDYPERPAGPATGRLVWRDRSLLRSAVATEHDPATGETFDGTFWGLLARPSLEVVGGDLAGETDVQAPPLVLRLPVRPSGLVVHSTPPTPPGVEIVWDRTLDFAARTLTLTATVKAGSVWPESGARDGEADPGLPRWTWTPWVFFMGWDFGDLINGGPGSWAGPGRVRPDGSYEAPRRLRPDGLPDLPVGLFDASFPPGSVVETAWGERAEVGGVRLPAPPGPSPTPHALRDARRDGAALSATEAEGGGLALEAEGTEIGMLAMPAATVDGTPRLLDDSTLLDRWAEPGGYVIELHETGGVFLSTLLVPGQGYAAYYLWDGHSTDGADHDVLIHTLVDPALGGDDGDLFREPFYTGEAYATERKVPQGVLDFPVGAALNGWIGSLPAIEAVDGEAGGSILHLQLWPNAPNTEPDALRTFAYLQRDHGTYDPDAEGAIAGGEDIVGTDVAMDLVNGYSGKIWDRGFLPYFSWFFVEPPDTTSGVTRTG